jgi:hypothetical protein
VDISRKLDDGVLDTSSRERAFLRRWVTDETTYDWMGTVIGSPE